MAKKSFKQPQNPLILRSQRLMEAFAKSDDERDFYLDRQEGFLIFVDLDQSKENLEGLQKELEANPERFCMIPKMSFYETKKIMEGFIHEKVYDIDTKEKLMDIIQAKEARENFIEFLYDQHMELEKWQQYYQERSRVRIIEWLRNNHFDFVFEEDLDVGVQMIEKLKEHLFDEKVHKEIATARKTLLAKAKSYYSTEALNPRPKRGRPPKQQQKLELEPQVSRDIYTTVTPQLRPFLFIPDVTHVGVASFSSKYASEEQFLASRKQTSLSSSQNILENLNQKLATLRQLAGKVGVEEESETNSFNGFDDEDEQDDDEEEELDFSPPKKAAQKKPVAKKPKKR